MKDFVEVKRMYFIFRLSKICVYRSASEY